MSHPNPLVTQTVVYYLNVSAVQINSVFSAKGSLTITTVPFLQELIGFPSPLLVILTGRTGALPDPVCQSLKQFDVAGTGALPDPVCQSLKQFAMLLEIILEALRLG